MRSHAVASVVVQPLAPGGRGAGGKRCSFIICKWRSAVRRSRNDHRSIRHAKWLRRNQTTAEQILWGALRNRGTANLKFRRQYPIEKYIVDFYCAEHRLIVEVDGDAHYGQECRDMKRTRWLQEHGCIVVRFTNREIKTNLTSVLEKIVESCGNS